MPPHLASIRACHPLWAYLAYAVLPCLTCAVHRGSAVCLARYAWGYSGTLSGMGKTSVYLTSEVAARWKASGVPLSELVRRGLDAHLAPDLETVLTMLRAELTAVHAPSLERVPAIAATVPTPVRTRSEEERHAEHVQEASAGPCDHRLPRGAWCKECSAAKP